MGERSTTQIVMKCPVSVSVVKAVMEFIEEFAPNADVTVSYPNMTITVWSDTLAAHVTEGQ
jgi:hypothetical protein